MLMDEQLSVAAELLRRLVVDRREAGRKASDGDDKTTAANGDGKRGTS
jgi:hypothetical protein